MKVKNVDKTKVNSSNGQIRVWETFAGIGAQHKAISNIDPDGNVFKVVKTSEWDVRAIIAYSQIHHKKDFDKKLIEISKWSNDEIDKYIAERVFSLNSKTPGKILRKDLSFKKTLVAANIVNNNYPDITRVSGKKLHNVDLLTYSFPCQGLSIANMGRDKGIKEEANSTSNLIWQIRRILLEAKKLKINLPKYLLMENVVNLIGKKHKDDYGRWIDFLKSLGYSTQTVVLNGFNHGSLQKRKRVFAISVLNDKKFEKSDLKQLMKEKYRKNMSEPERKRLYEKILNSSNEFIDEIKDATPNKTASRIRMANENRDLLTYQWKDNKMSWTFATLTTKQDRHPNIGMIKTNLKLKGKLNKRFITPREAYQIMGFENEDFSKVKTMFNKGILTKESLYRQAGNSIVVPVLEDIFKFIKNWERGKNV